MTTDDQPLGVSPLEHVKREISRAADERRLTELAERLGIGPAHLARFRPTGLRPDAQLEALVPDPLVAVAFRLRIRGVPYIAEAPITGSPPGYRLHPDRHQRWQDRTAGPVARPRPPRFLTRTQLAGGCHPAFMLWCMTAAGDLR